MNLHPLAALSLTMLIIGFVAGCGKDPSRQVVFTAPATNPTAVADKNSSAAPTGPGAPAPLATPATPDTIASDNIDATLADLTRELHRTMIGRRLSGSFEEFVAIRNLKVPPPPSGKKYAISKQWKVILVEQ